MKNFLKDVSKNYSSEIYAKTKKYQKDYGFEIGKGSQDTWNNESDAFKHTFGSADLAIKMGDLFSKKQFDKHEADMGDKNPKGEKNMDLWNNHQGRQIAKEIKKEYNFLERLKMIHSGEMDDIIAEKVVNKMNKGELITHPSDKRSYEKDLLKQDLTKIEDNEMLKGLIRYYQKKEK